MGRQEHVLHLQKRMVGRRRFGVRIDDVPTSRNVAVNTEDVEQEGHIAGAPPSLSGNQYRCLAANAVSSATSSAATLTEILDDQALPVVEVGLPALMMSRTLL